MFVNFNGPTVVDVSLYQPYNLIGRRGAILASIVGIPSPKPQNKRCVCVGRPMMEVWTPAIAFRLVVASLLLG